MIRAAALAVVAALGGCNGTAPDNASGEAAIEARAKALEARADEAVNAMIADIEEEAAEAAPPPEEPAVTINLTE
jgi:hypothetical protein